MDFSAILEDYNEAVSASAVELRKWVQAAHPDIMEEPKVTPKMAYAFYHIGPRNNPVCMIQPADDHCKLYLHHFDQVDLRGLPLTGTGKNARHIKFFSPEEAAEPRVGSVVQEVAAITAARNK